MTSVLPTKRMPPQDSSGLQEHIYQERHMRIACIGAGASGLLLAYKLQRSFRNFELILYEKNENIGGTWYENKYPGCACDVPAHSYVWSFEPKADWSSVYAGSDEILGYFEAFAVKYELHKFCKTRHLVSLAKWNDGSGSWDLEIQNLSTGDSLQDSCDILINASGVLNAWKWPSISGLKDYKGVLVHTANYDRSLDLTGKHVGVIGNGSSAIQVIPAIHPKVLKITTFIRGPTWIAPTSPENAQRIFTGEEKAEFAQNPDAHVRHRKELDTRASGRLFPTALVGSELQLMMRDIASRGMRERLNNPGLEEKLIPTFDFGCRRPTPGVNYLETLQQDNVEVVYGEIERATEHGLLSADGKEHSVDVLICATGFDTSFKPRFPILGLGGKSLAEEWKDEPKAYFGVAVPNFPNYFTVIGPNSPVGTGPFLCAVEAQIDYMLKFMNRWQTENIHSFSPKVAAVEEFVAYKDQFMQRTVWQQDCHSWYKLSGKVVVPWPGSSLHYMEAIADVRYDDWDIKYNGNRFAWLGNGFSQTEVDKTADWAYYIRTVDNGPYMSHWKQIECMNRPRTVNPMSNQPLHT